MSPIKASKVSKTQDKITPTYFHENSLVFSWKYYDSSLDNFHLEHKSLSYVLELLDQLKILSEKTLLEAKEAGDALRFHRIDFKTHNVSEKTLGIKNEGLMADENAYQFQLSKRNGRVIGFMLNNTFYIRWFDPEHNLYPQRFGITPCPRGFSDCEQRLKELENTHSQIMEYLDKETAPKA